MATEGGIVIRKFGDKKVAAAFKRIEAPAERKALMEAIGAYGVSSTQQRFIDEKGPDGTPWKKSMRGAAEGHTLRLHGYLASSFSWAATPEQAEWGTPIAYAGIHQFGGVITAKAKGALRFRLFNGAFVTVKSVTMPARPMLGISEKDTAEIDDITVKWLQGAFK